MTMNNTCGNKNIFSEIPFNKEYSYTEDHYQRLLTMAKYPVHSIPEYTAVYDMSEETSTNQKNIKVTKEYLRSWQKIFSDQNISCKIKSSIKKDIINAKIKLLIHYHRNELNWADFLKSIFLISCSKQNFIFIIKNIRWKLQNR